LTVGTGQKKELFGKMLLDAKQGTLTPTSPKAAKSALVSCDVLQGFVPNGALNVEVVMCKAPDSFKKFKPSIKCKKEAQTTCSATTASKDSGSWNAKKNMEGREGTRVSGSSRFELWH